MLTSSGQDDTYMQPNLCAAEWMRQISSQVSPVLLNGVKDTDITHFPSVAEWHEGRRYHTFPHCCWITWRTQISHISPLLLNDVKDTDITHFPSAAEWREGHRYHTFPQCCWMTWRTQISHISPLLLNDVKDTDITHFPSAAEWHEGHRYNTFPQCCWMTWRTQISHISPVLLNDMKDADSIIGFPSAAEGHTALQVSPVLLKDMKDTDIRDVTSSLPFNWSHAVCTLHTHTTHTDTYTICLCDECHLLSHCLEQ